jgi:hypothetical protein
MVSRTSRRTAMAAPVTQSTGAVPSETAVLGRARRAANPLTSTASHSRDGKRPPLHCGRPSG